MSQRAYNLHCKHTLDELRDMEHALMQDPANWVGQQMTAKSRQKLDDVLWAMYWHRAPKGNERMQVAEPGVKWW